MRIADLPLSERPREKALEKGLKSLSDAELLALLIGQGVKGDSALEIARRLLVSYPSLKAMTDISPSLFAENRGISLCKGLLLAAAFEIGHRVSIASIEDRYVPEEVYQRFSGILSGKRNESLYLLIYGKKGHLIKEKEIAVGSYTGVMSDGGIILSSVLEVKGLSFVIIHNHPSGNSSPSNEDRAFTICLAHNASYLGLALLDHLIIGEGEYYSFLEHREEPSTRNTLPQKNAATPCQLD